MSESQPFPRPLSSEEFLLVDWMLRHGDGAAADFVSQLPTLQVVSGCRCGCASINFVALRATGMTILADFKYRDPGGHVMGAFLFAYDSELAGLDLWSIDGAATPTVLPAADTLEPLD